MHPCAWLMGWVGWMFLVASEKSITTLAADTRATRAPRRGSAKCWIPFLDFPVRVTGALLHCAFHLVPNLRLAHKAFGLIALSMNTDAPGHAGLVRFSWSTARDLLLKEGTVRRACPSCDRIVFASRNACLTNTAAAACRWFAGTRWHRCAI